MKQFATITVIGRDKTGVIARVTSFLFAQNANIEALEEQVTRGQFSMTIQASWKLKQLDESSLRSGLKKLSDELGMEIRLRLTRSSAGFAHQKPTLGFPIALSFLHLSVRLAGFCCSLGQRASIVAERRYLPGHQLHLPDILLFLVLRRFDRSQTHQESVFVGSGGVPGLQSP